MNELEQRLERTLTARADTVVAGARLSTDAVVTAGRAARRRRRQGAVVAAAAGALAVVVAAGALAQARVVGTAPVPPGSAPASSAPVSGVPIGVFGVDVAVFGGNRVVPAEGAPFTMPLPAGHGITALTRVPSGWVVESYLESEAPEAGSYLWFMPDGGDLVGLGRLWGNQKVSPDGRRMVVAAAGDYRLGVVAYELPSLRSIGRVRVGDLGVTVRGVVGDVVVLSDTSGDGSPTRAYVWNPRTGQLRASDREVNVWGVADDGRVLRRFVQNERRACVDLVRATDLPTVRDTGLCSDRMTVAATFWADLSPDGEWVMTHSGPDLATVWVRAADLRAGRWRPVASGLPDGARPQIWDSDRSVIARVEEGEYVRCVVAGPCRSVVLPELPDGPVLVERRG